MATVHNPTDFTLFCLVLRRSIDAGETVTVVPELARKVPLGVFVVDVEQARPTSGTATRKTVTRGAKKVEVTEAPATESR